MEDGLVELSIYPDEQCSLWYCTRRRDEDNIGYCTEAHFALSDLHENFAIPAHMSNLFTHYHVTALLVCFSKSRRSKLGLSTADREVSPHEEGIS
ncbi:unnamed protein product [Arabis nemorensis]|uniref:Uncharacterized protein n=1 Tax=Arabis nemorensis TaxID=586526 RepID=A0A565BLR3_9BRAS|nr:unnamed protein product [Arabis nemorensis]